MPFLSTRCVLLLAFLLPVWACSSPRSTAPRPTAQAIDAPADEIRILIGSEPSGVHWQLVSDRIGTLQELRVVLRRLHGDNVLPVVVDPGPNATYEDVAHTLDAITEAGFTEISFGSSRGARK